MVTLEKSLLLISVFIFFFHPGAIATPTIEAFIDSTSAEADKPLEGTLTITRLKTEQIDPNSFQLNQKPLKVVFIKDTPLISDNIISIYQFSQPAKSPGLYLLPSIEVKIDGKLYHSVGTSYEIKNYQINNNKSQSQTKKNQHSSAPKDPLVFNLETTVKGPSVLYPGQRTKFFYRISYNRDIDLSKSDLPLIHPGHFKKIGDVQIKDFEDSSKTYQDLTQEVEASEIGTFTFGPSSIEGYTYKVQNGQKIYDKTLLHSQTDPITVEVKAFPIDNQPASFTGAIGKIHAEAKLESSETLTQGDLIQLKLTIAGVDNIEDFKLPDLACQPGFNGFFQFQDTPPLTEFENQTKIFHIPLRPLTSWIKNIPPIQVSSFDTLSKQYVISLTKPLAIEIQQKIDSPLVQPSAFFLWKIQNNPQSWPKPILQESIPLISLPYDHSSHAYDVCDFKFMLLLALLYLALYGQWILQKWLQNPSKNKLPMSYQFLKQALDPKMQINDKASFLEKALWHHLCENQILAPNQYRTESIPVSSNLDNYRRLIILLQEFQYGLKKDHEINGLIQDVKKLINRDPGS